MKETQSHYDVIIIGSGPAGLTAGIYSARARQSTLIFTGREHGGQLMETTLVENFPGFPEGVMGPKLMMDMAKQAENQGAQILMKEVTKVDFSKDPKEIYVGEEKYTAQAVIIAMGSKPRTLGVPGEQRLWGRGVSACATCDGAFYKDKVVAVIGGGDSAVEEADFVTRFASKVYLVHRRGTLRASKAMQDRAFANEKIEIIWNAKVVAVLGEDKVTALQLQLNEEALQRDDNENNDYRPPEELKVDGVFLAIGHIPNNEILRGQVDMDERGFVKVTDHTKTSVDGVFVAGDIHDHEYQQAITAAGMGCQAALDAEKWLMARG